MPASRSHFVRTLPSQRRRGFSLVEALVALTIMTMAGSVMLLAIESCLTSTSDAVDKLIADGMANQLLDEISVRRFMAVGDTPLTISGPSATEAAASGRQLFNDLDDYKNVSSMPAKGIWGETLGTGNDSGGARNTNFCIPSTQFTRWRQRVDIYFVSATDHSQKLTSGTSYYRAVEVNIEYVATTGSVKPLAKRRRVYAYLPPHT
ncbi:type IV pilus modification PilV family protein [Anatilimnocola floriformis]|uniref:type IV pilus modification PilV family protein n=1 Tax=Anatilimnocola floriformis TaxID=2948575 RepID=UPI0020C53927|nr:prepilin-type N-terminal cleavage/methylation domain-containing protein [Anatilimnocola floriformis]